MPQEVMPILTPRYLSSPSSMNLNREMPFINPYGSSFRNTGIPYRRNRYKPRIHVSVVTDKRGSIPSAADKINKRQLFELVPFITAGKSIKQTMNGEKRTKQGKSRNKKLQKREDITDIQVIKVPFFAESNLGIIQNKNKEELFESSEKKDKILRMQKRAAKNWNMFGGHTLRDSVHGKIGEKNSILQLLRSAAGKKSQNILGLNSKSFDIFPGPLPEDSGGSFGKASTEVPQQFQQPKHMLRQPALVNDRLYATPKHRFHQTPQVIRTRPISPFRQQRQYQSYTTNYQPVMPAARSVLRQKPIVINSPAQNFNNYASEVEPMQMQTRKYEQPYAPTQEYYPSQPVRTSRANMIPMQSAPVYTENHQDPGALKQEEYAPFVESTGMSTSMRYPPYYQQRPAETSMPVNIRRDLNNEQDLDVDQLQRNQDEDLANQQMLIAQEQQENPAITTRQGLPSIPYMSNNLFRFPKANEGQVTPQIMETEASEQRYVQPENNIPVASFENAPPLRRRVVSSHIPTPEDVQTQSIDPSQFSQYAPVQQQLQQPAQTVNTGDSSRNHIKQKSSDDDNYFDDEEKPEVHVHISTEKSNISRPKKTGQ